VARRLVCGPNRRNSTRFGFLLVFVLAIVTSSFGQPTTPQALSNPWAPQPSVSKNPGSIINSAFNTPNPNSGPTHEQTAWYVNNNRALSSLDAATKTNIVNGAHLPFLTSSPSLPNGQSNPFFQNGQSTPNWFLRSTWSSPTMSWQGVQPNGFLPPVAKIYNPSSITTVYGSGGASNPNPVPTYHPTFRAPPQAVNRPLQPPDQKPLQFRSQQTQNQIDRALGSRPSNIGKAIEDRERALSVHEAAGDKVAQATDHAELAQLYAQDENREQALEHISVGERMAEEIADPRSQADFLRGDAAVHMSLGEFEQSLSTYQKAMPILRSLGDEKGQAEVYASVGWAFQSLGRTSNALNCYNEARYLFEKLGDTDGEVRILIGVGSLYQAMGEFNEAAENYRRALPHASKDQQARMLASVGEMHLSREEPSEAIHNYQAALTLVPSSGNSALEGAILAGMGRCYMALGSVHSYSQARNLFEQARAKMKDAGDRTGEAGVIASLGELHYWIAINWMIANPNPEFLEASKNYAEALPLMRDAGDRMGEIGVLANMGLVFDARGKYREALRSYLQALQKMDELQTSARIDEFRIDIANQSAGLYQRAILLDINLNHTEEAFNLSERARARTFLDQLGNRRINGQLPEDFVRREERLRQENVSLQRRIGQEMSKPGPEIDQEKILSLESKRSSIQTEYSSLVNELKVENPEYASFLSIAPLTLREAQRQLGPDLTVISYFTTREVTLAFVLTRNTFHVSKLPVTQAELAWAVTTFLDFSGESGVPTSLKLLHKSLIAPVKSQLKTTRLAIVPYGILHDVPFAALTPDGTHYLSDDHAVFSLPSLSVLPYIRARNKTNTNKALVFANGQEEGLSYLGSSYGEARDVASFFNTQPVLGDAATASAFQKNAGDYDVIHLIAHFDHDENNPEFPRVMLGHGENDDGALQLDQVVGLDLRKTSLVVLSGCRSQAGKLSRGDDIVGLSRAFIYAGSPSVIASLWSVDDEATRALMVLFYSHLRQGLSKAEALRAAQMDMRQKYPHPYYWAGFVLTGDPGPAGIPNLLASSPHQN
jgi:CHAT domain-containing protein/tetratricopeptide (TPR) repeat protein